MNIPRNFERTFDVRRLYDGPPMAVHRRDRWGFRGHYADLGDIDILTIGGSTTAQTFIGEGHTWQDYLRARFAAAGHAVSVVNAGIDGQSTLGHLAAFDRWLSQIPGLRARWVLAFIGLNDVYVSAAKQYDEMESPDWQRRVSQYVRNHSALVALYQMLSGHWRAHKAQIVHGAGKPEKPAQWIETTPLLPPPTPTEARALEEYAARVGRLISRIRAFGAEAIIVTQSRADYRVDRGAVFGRLRESGEIDVGSWAVQTAFNQRAMAACRAAAAICLDLGSELRFGDDDFYDWGHTTPSGNRRIADYLHDRLNALIAR